MPGLKEDKFIKRLKAMIQEFPEFAPFLTFLVTELQKGTQAQVVAKIKLLQQKPWS